ncbi:hypothetical protein D3C87_1535600 [compost metagenome]
MFKGTCVIKEANNTFTGLNYQNYNEEANYAYFGSIDLTQCPYGYGTGRVSDTKAGTTCLIPYRSMSADPQAHKLGDVIYIPAADGLKLPDGKVHDGFFVVSDYATGYVGTGKDQFSVFTGFFGEHSEKNPFKKIGLTNPENQFKYFEVSKKRAQQVREKIGFKIIKTHNRTFIEPQNPMIDGN